jgi:hypothetical protein
MARDFRDRTKWTFTDAIKVAQDSVRRWSRPAVVYRASDEYFVGEYYGGDALGFRPLLQNGAGYYIVAIIRRTPQP